MPQDVEAAGQPEASAAPPQGFCRKSRVAMTLIAVCICGGIIAMQALRLASSPEVLQPRQHHVIDSAFSSLPKEEPSAAKVDLRARLSGMWHTVMQYEDAFDLVAQGKDLNLEAFEDTVEAAAHVFITNSTLGMVQQLPTAVQDAIHTNLRRMTLNSEIVVPHVFATIDANKDDLISRTEFVQFSQLLESAPLDITFRVLDLDSDGRVSRAELVAFFGDYLDTCIYVAEQALDVGKLAMSAWLDSMEPEQDVINTQEWLDSTPYMVLDMLEALASANGDTFTGTSLDTILEMENDITQANIEEVLNVWVAEPSDAPTAEDAETIVALRFQNATMAMELAIMQATYMVASNSPLVLAGLASAPPMPTEPFLTAEDRANARAAFSPDITRLAASLLVVLDLDASGAIESNEVDAWKKLRAALTVTDIEVAAAKRQATGQPCTLLDYMEESDLDAQLVTDCKAMRDAGVAARILKAITHIARLSVVDDPDEGSIPTDDVTPAQFSEAINRITVGIVDAIHSTASAERAVIGPYIKFGLSLLWPAGLTPNDDSISLTELNQLMAAVQARLQAMSQQADDEPASLRRMLTALTAPTSEAQPAAAAAAAAAAGSMLSKALQLALSQ